MAYPPQGYGGAIPAHNDLSGLFGGGVPHNHMEATQYSQVQKLANLGLQVFDYSYTESFEDYATGTKWPKRRNPLWTTRGWYKQDDWDDFGLSVTEERARTGTKALAIGDTQWDEAYALQHPAGALPGYVEVWVYDDPTTYNAADAFFQLKMFNSYEGQAGISTPYIYLKGDVADIMASFLEPTDATVWGPARTTGWLGLRIEYDPASCLFYFKAWPHGHAGWETFITFASHNPMTSYPAEVPFWGIEVDVAQNNRQNWWIIDDLTVYRRIV